MVGEYNNNDVYSRQRDIPLAIPRSATVVGVGGVGSWVAALLAMSGVRKLYLYDPDIVESTNLNRIPLPMADIGKPKVHALRDWLITLRPDALIVAAQIHASDVVMIKSDILFDCTDDFKVREVLYKWAQENNAKYIRAGYDGGEHITVAPTLPWWVGDQAGRYEVTPSWVIPALFCAMAAVYMPLRGCTGTIGANIGDIMEAAMKLNGRKDE